MRFLTNCSFDLFNNETSSTEYVLFGGKKISSNPVVIPKVLNELDKLHTEDEISDQNTFDKILSSTILPADKEDAPSENDETEPNETFSALPEKSKFKYERQYEFFVEWCGKRNITQYTESVLMQYFTEKSKSAKSSTLWSLYSMLRATMALKTNVNISNYKKLTAFLKKTAIGYKSEKTKLFSREEINRFLTYAPDESYLMMKVYSEICLSHAIIKIHLLYSGRPYHVPCGWCSS